jgi:plastocyanin
MKCLRGLVALAILAGSAACIDRGVDLGPFDEGVVDMGGEADAGVEVDGGETVCVPGVVSADEADHQLAYLSFAVSDPGLEIAAGEAVVWRNDDSDRHTVTEGVPPVGPGGPAPAFDGILLPGKTWAYRFCEPGVYVYYCAPHAGSMRDYEIIVQ